jgi:hypothetical protein
LCHVFFGIERRLLRLKAQGDSERRFVSSIAFAGASKPHEPNRSDEPDSSTHREMVECKAGPVHSWRLADKCSLSDTEDPYASSDYHLARPA